MKVIVSNDLHPLNKELISLSEDGLKFVKSIDIIFSTFLSYVESKKWSKRSTEDGIAIKIHEVDFISKELLNNVEDLISLKAKRALFLYSLISSLLYLKPFL